MVSRSVPRAWLQLLRVPNHPTAWADVLAGGMFVWGGWPPAAALAALLGSSWALYAAGMVLNDVFDFEQDARERPSRPLPSGRIARPTALAVGIGLLAVGMACAVGAAWFCGDWRPVIVATVLALLVLAYDGWLKPTRWAPFVMGACRTANWLLGMTAGVSAHASWCGFETAGLVAAAGIGVYVCGITWFARDEAGAPRRSEQVVGLLLMLGGLGLWAAVGGVDPFATGARSLRFSHPIVWPLLVVMIGFPVLRRGLVAMMGGSPGGAIKLMIFSIIVLDAALVLATATGTAALLVLSLLLPAWLLGKWVYST